MQSNVNCKNKKMMQFIYVDAGQKGNKYVSKLETVIVFCFAMYWSTDDDTPYI